MEALLVGSPNETLVKKWGAWCNLGRFGTDVSERSRCRLSGLFSRRGDL